MTRQSPPDDAQAKSADRQVGIGPITKPDERSLEPAESAPSDSPERELLREVAKRGATTDILRRIDAMLAASQVVHERHE